MTSILSPHAHKMFHEAPPTAPLVLKRAETKQYGEYSELFAADLVKCRRNCLRLGAADFSIFNVLDNIVPAMHGTLGD